MSYPSLPQRFSHAAQCLSRPIAGLLEPLPVAVKAQTQEIRLRAGQPLALHNGQKHLFVGMDNALYEAPGSRCYIVTPQDVQECFQALCEYSVHTHSHEIKSGYIAIKGGHRAGICGTAVFSDKELHTLRDITSINLRIAKEIPGAAAVLAQRLASGPYGLLLAGPPSSGKTTLLRDLGRQLGGGSGGNYYKIAVVDERGELAASVGGQPQNDLGCCADVLTGYRKGEGILIALRTLSPQVILCDEIGTHEEIEAVEAGLNSGVAVIASVHTSTAAELLTRPQTRRLLYTGAFEEIVVLQGSSQPSQIKEIIKVGDCIAQAGGNWDAGH